MSVLRLENVSFSCNSQTQALQNFNFIFEKGTVYGITGESDAEKTTLLTLLSGLAQPTAGSIYYCDRDITKMNRYEYRSQYVGVVFQDYNLMPRYTALGNVVLSMDVSRKKFANKRAHAMETLGLVDLDEATARRKVLALSGGEQLRVAIARALSYRPNVILADEPTGNLDLDTQAQVLAIFRRIAKETDTCVILFTRSPEVAMAVDALYQMAPPPTQGALL